MSTTPSNHDNPLLDFSDLPRFGEIRPEHVTPALDVLLADAAAAVERAALPVTPIVVIGGGYAGTSRRIRRKPAARYRILVERRTKSRAVRKVQGA